MKKCKHKFTSDSSQCIKCGKTISDILEEDKLKAKRK